MLIDRSVVDVMKREGARQYPNEACGFVVQTGKKTTVVTAENSAEDPSSYFRIAPIEYARAADMGEIVGVWHTHPDKSAQPTGQDVRGCNNSAVPWYIMGINNVEGVGFEYSEIVVVTPDSDKAAYVGRAYVPNVHDCYTLVRDYYKREYGIEMSRYENIEDWWLKGHNFFIDNFMKEGFVEVTDEPQFGDVFIIKANSDIPNHVGIYVSNDRMLHHLMNRLSRHDTVSGYWYENVAIRVRHSSKC